MNKTEYNQNLGEKYGRSGLKLINNALPFPSNCYNTTLKQQLLQSLFHSKIVSFIFGKTWDHRKWLMIVFLVKRLLCSVREGIVVKFTVIKCCHCRCELFVWRSQRLSKVSNPPLMGTKTLSGPRPIEMRIIVDHPCREAGWWEDSIWTSRHSFFFSFCV